MENLIFCAVSYVAVFSTPKSSKIERLENVKPYWKGVENGRFRCSIKQAFLCQPSVVADIFEDFEPASKKFLATPEKLEKNSVEVHLFAKCNAPIQPGSS